MKITLEQLVESCPAKVWVSHLFSADVQLLSGETISVPFNMPLSSGVKAISVDADLIREKFGHQIEASREEDLMPQAGPDEVYAAVASVMNMRMGMMKEAVTLHVKVARDMLRDLAMGQWVRAYSSLVVLERSLQNDFYSDSEFYGWPSWITKVQTYIEQNADQRSLKTIENMYR